NGAAGLDGTDGSMIYTGHGIPSNSLGVDDDIYINVDNNEYYQKGSNLAGEWEPPVGTLGSGGSGGVTDHGALTGLGDDDHTQYLTDARGDLKYATIDHTHSISSLGNELNLTLQKIEVLHWMGVN
ncbi:MAG: hypothetical protein U9Q40_05670, partial [Campylobacterota bacterium]|nr:hypothetical protein [Campylobacterota bacterium]